MRAHTATDLFIIVQGPSVSHMGFWKRHMPRWMLLWSGVAYFTRLSATNDFGPFCAFPVSARAAATQIGQALSDRK